MNDMEENVIVLNENSTIKGWVVLPCFKVESHGEDGEFEMKNNILGWVFTNMFAWLWDGKVHISKVYDGDRVVYPRWQ
jgi:hypothetical protein